MTPLTTSYTFGVPWTALNCLASYLCTRSQQVGLVYASDISVLKIITVSLFIQFWVLNFYSSSSFSFEIIIRFHLCLFLHRYICIDRQQDGRTADYMLSDVNQ